MSTMNVVNKEKLANMMTNTDSTINEITLGLELAAAIVGMIPWGSYANPGEKGAEETQEQVRKNAIGNIEHEVEDEFQQVEQQAGQQVEKSFARKLLDGIKNFFGTTAQNIGSALFETLLNNDYSWLVAENSLKEYQSHRAGPTPPKAPSPGAMKNMTEELVRQTVPTLTGSYVKDLQSLADASWKDCLPLQFGLSKVMCDLFCIDDAVRSGTSAVLSSLQSSHQVLMTNLQSLLDYQTKYLLWAIGSIVSPKALWEVKQKQKGFEEEDFLSAPDLLQDLEELQEFPVKNHSMTDHLMLGREVLDWHEATADELMSRITAMFMNASEDNWPYRARAMKGMLHHYGKSLKEKISEAQMPLRQSHLGPSFAQKQIDGKLQLLSDQANQHREVAEVVQTLRMQPLEFHLEDQIVWNSILESFLHTHEKQDAFTMLHLKALDQTEDALNLAQNFSQCAGASSASLRESWQRALRADERSSEALLEAWSATITTAERLRIAVKDERFLERLPQHIDLEAGSAVLTASCQNHTALAQESYSQAVALVASSLQPLATQINTFKALATYQEQQLRHRRLEYLAAPEAFMSSELTALLTTLSDPSTTLGRALAKRALKVLGNPRCPGEELLVEDVTLRAEPVKSLLMF